MPNIEEMIQNLIEGAQRAGAKVEFKPSCGRESKLAIDTSTYLGGVPGFGPGLAGLSAAADTGNMGGGLLSGMGSGLGQLAGGTAGAGLGGLAGKHIAQLLEASKHDRELAEMLGMGLGGLGGVIGGGMLGSASGRAIVEPTKQGALQSVYLNGAHTAFDQYKIGDQQKLAIWGQLAGLAGRALPAIGGLVKNPGVRNFAKDVAMQAGTGLAANKLMNTVSPQ
jgi:hypothetical protein